MKTKTKPWLLTIVGLLLVIVALVGIKAGQIRKMIAAGKAFVPPPESVASSKVQAVEWAAKRSAIATLVAVRGVTLGSELAGLVREIHFESGASVKRGAVLVKLDTSTEEAQLTAALADASLAQINLERAQALRRGGANSPADLDAARARAKQTAATVATLRATIAKKTIRAPFDGRVAIRQVELGQVLSAGAPVASLQSVTPIYADFWLPQQALAEISVGQRVQLRTDVFPGSHWEGSITTINPEVDVNTRNVRIRATFDNPGGRLRPGMFADLQVISAEKHHALIIPETAVMYAPYGDSVFTIDEKKNPAGEVSRVVQKRFVRLGEHRGDFVAVTDGLEAGQTVVSAGAFKLRNGMAVVLNNGLAPRPELAPRPTEQ